MRHSQRGGLAAQLVCCCSTCLCCRVLCVCVCARYAFVEFEDIEAVNQAMQLTGVVFGDRPIK